MNTVMVSVILLVLQAKTPETRMVIEAEPCCYLRNGFLWAKDEVNENKTLTGFSFRWLAFYVTE